MGLQDLNVDSLLNAQIEAYLKTGATYAELRAKCLTLTPIQLIIAPIMHQLNDAAKEDKSNKTGQLTQHAHALQADQDSEENENDCKRRLQCNNEKDTLKNCLQYGAGQLDEKRRHQRGLKTALDEIKNELRFVQEQIKQRTTENHLSFHLHQHHSMPVELARAEIKAGATRHVHRDESLESLQARANALIQRVNKESHSIDQINREVNDLERRMSAFKTELERLAHQMALLNQRETARQQREQYRRNSAPINNLALSTENAATLNDDIQHACTLIDRRCQDKKKDAVDRCYLAFITQLAKHVDGLALQPHEKIALSQLIATMQQHLRDLTACQEQQSLLDTYVNTLQSQELQYATNGVRFRALQTEHADLVNTNDRLGAELRILQGQQQTFETQRNEYAQYALMTTIAAGLSTIAGYFLIHTGVLVVAPIMPVVLAAVVGTAVVTLLAMAGVAGIRALLRQSEATSVENTIIQNTARIGQTTTDLASLGDEAPQLLERIAHYRILIDQQRLVTNAAQDTANRSLEDAQAITIVTANLEMEAAPNRYRFHSTEPSATPVPRDNDVGRLAHRSIFGGGFL